MKEAKKFREEHDHQFRQGLMSPQHFGYFIGFEHIFGPPPPETILTLEEAKRREFEAKKERAEQAQENLVGILGRAAAKGATLTPVI